MQGRKKTKICFWALYSIAKATAKGGGEKDDICSFSANLW